MLEGVSIESALGLVKIELQSGVEAFEKGLTKPIEQSVLRNGVFRGDPK
jgi:hypothetical protein